MIGELDQLNRGLERLVEERTAALREGKAELRAQNLRFDAALSNMSQALLMFDSAARLVICNQRYIEMYGLSPEAGKARAHGSRIARRPSEKRNIFGRSRPVH